MVPAEAQNILGLYTLNAPGSNTQCVSSSYPLDANLAVLRHRSESMARMNMVRCGERMTAMIETKTAITVLPLLFLARSEIMDWMHRASEMAHGLKVVLDG